METLYVVDFRNLSLTIVGIYTNISRSFFLSLFLSVKFNFIIIFTLQYGYQGLILGIEVSGSAIFLLFACIYFIRSVFVQCFLCRHLFKLFIYFIKILGYNL